MARRLANVVGIDDAPHSPGRRKVAVVGIVTARCRVDGLLVSHVQRDGRNSTSRIASLVQESPFNDHIQAVVLQGITFGGFNVVDLHTLHEMVNRPVLVVARHRPRMARIESALNHVPGGQRKWQLIQRAGPPEPLRKVFVQRAGLTSDEAAWLLAATTQHGNLPEALRVAHLIAGGLATGTSHGGA